MSSFKRVCTETLLLAISAFAPNPITSSIASLRSKRSFLGGAFLMCSRIRSIICPTRSASPTISAERFPDLAQDFRLAGGIRSSCIHCTCHYRINNLPSAKRAPGGLSIPMPRSRPDVGCVFERFSAPVLGGAKKVQLVKTRDAGRDRRRRQASTAPPKRPMSFRVQQFRPSTRLRDFGPPRLVVMKTEELLGVLNGT